MADFLFRITAEFLDQLNTCIESKYNWEKNTIEYIGIQLF